MRLHPLTSQAFERLFRTYYTRLYYFAYDYVGDTELSKDIVSEVFAAVWRERERMEEDRVTGYLYISVRNLCLDHLRSLHKRDEYIEACMQDAQLEADDVETLEEQLADMAREIEQMSPRTRYILEQCYYHNKKYKEVAEVLEISTDGIKKHIVKAFAQLRKHFGVKKQ